MPDFASKADPAGWLGAAFERTRTTLGPPRALAPRFSHLRLRGITSICKSRLGKALDLTAIPWDDNGSYLVLDLKECPYDDLTEEAFTWLQSPVFSMRKGELDLEGWNSYWVNLTDPYIEPCYCRDMYVVAPSLGTPCKHLLAALLAAGVEEVVREAEELERRSRIAAALRGE